MYTFFQITRLSRIRTQESQINTDPKHLLALRIRYTAWWIIFSST
jgi:hypothetical protein